MVTLTQSAKLELEQFFKDRPQSGIRIYIAPGGCSGLHLALALDEPTENDKAFEAEGFTFCIDNNLFEQIQGAKIDAGFIGFSVEPVVPLPDMGCGCGGGCGSCGGGCGH